MSNAMYQKLTYLILITFLIFSCSKKEPELNLPADKEKSYEIYKEAVESMNKGDFFYAAKKFSEAEAILPKIEFSARASLMSSYCLYIINFYPEAVTNLERFIKQYPADKNVAYAHYLIAITSYEQILDEKKDIKPLLKSKEKMQFFIQKFPDTEYALDLKNPFVGMYFDKSAGVSKRLPISLEDILNIQQECRVIDDDLRWLVAVVSDTGMRLAEAAGLLKSDIILDSVIPHISLKPYPWRPLKTSGSQRDIPLVGASLWAIQRLLEAYPDSVYAFPRYNKTSTTNANSASAALNKWLHSYA